MVHSQGILRLITIFQVTVAVGNVYSFHSLNLPRILLVGFIDVGIAADNLISVCYLHKWTR